VTIVVCRRTGGFAVVRRLRVTLDGRTVGRVRHNRTVEVTGSGGAQQLSVSIDRARSNVLTVTDPGVGSVLEVDVAHRGVADSVIRSWLAPESVLVLVPAGQPAPPPPPVRLGWRRIARLWLVVTAGTVALATLSGLRADRTLDLTDVAGMVLGVSLGLALAVAAAAVALRHRNGH
jgi:hypothetical protein